MIYLDNAATTFYKPETVYQAVADTMRYKGVNVGRGGYRLAIEASDLVYQCRENLGRLFHTDRTERICFAQNTTDALNLAIHGLLKQGDHAIIGSMEHNSVLRPVHTLAEAGLITYSVALADSDGVVRAEAVERLIQPETRLIALNHASNVCGSISDIAAIAALAKERAIPFLIDAAQSAGALDINVEKLPVALLAFAGHKGLYGPQGTGGLYIAPGIELEPVRQGGTGSLSESYRQPGLLPDRYESGTLNLPGIAGLSAGVEYILEQGTAQIAAHEADLVKMLLEGLCNMNGVTVYGIKQPQRQTGVVAFTLQGTDSVELCEWLDQNHGIAARGGLHCAPLAHKTLGTLSTGVVRFSVSAFTSKDDIKKAISAIYQKTIE